MIWELAPSTTKAEYPATWVADRSIDAPDQPKICVACNETEGSIDHPSAFDGAEQRDWVWTQKHELLLAFAGPWIEQDVVTDIVNMCFIYFCPF